MRRASLITRMGRRDGLVQARAAASVINPRDRINYLLDQSYGVGVTRMDREPFGPAPGRDSQVRTGPITTTEIPFQLVGGAEATVLASQDPSRTGMVLQNADPTNNLFYSFGALAGPTSRFLTPGQTLLRDFDCPKDRISVYAAVNISGSLAVEAPAG